MTENERVYLKIYDYETKEFSGLTTYHGLVRIYNSNTWPSRIFWSVVVLSCLSLFMIHSGYLLLGYHSKPTLFQINTIVPENGIHFPDITICNHMPIDYEKAKSYANMSDSLLEYIIQFYNDIDESFAYFDKDYRKQREYEQFIEKHRNTYGIQFDIRDFIKNISKSCEQSLVSCSFGKKMIHNCCEQAKEIMTDFGLCFQFSNKNGKLRQYYSGDGYGWQFVLDARNSNNDHKIASIYTDHGFQLIVHEHEKQPRIINNGISVPPNEFLHASMNIKNISLLERDNWGVCQNDWRESHYVNLTYTAPHCEVECHLNRTIDICGCAPLNLLTNIHQNFSIRACKPIEMPECQEKLNEKYRESCSCDSECHLLEFDILSSYSDIPNFVYTKMKFDQDYISQNISMISVFSRQVAYERHEQQKQLQTADLLSNIAGSMGLFLGMSTVTLLEIFIYLFKSVWGTVNSARQKQFVEAVAEEERERQQSLIIIQDDNDESATQNDNMSIRPTQANEREARPSATPIHIHLDRKNSRMFIGGDLLSGSRGSINAPTHLLSPLSKHRKSLNVAYLSRQDSAPSSSAVPTSGFNSSVDMLPPRTPARRSSSVAPPTFFGRKRQSDVGRNELSHYREPLQRKSSIQAFKSQLL